MILGSVVFAMTQTAVPFVASYTILAVENVVGIFVAVMAFQALDDATDEIVELHSRTLTVVLHAMVWLLVGALLAWHLRGRGGKSLEVYCACGGHFVSFFS